MFSVLTLFGPPVDASDFHRHFEKAHRPLLQQVPHAQRHVIHWIAAAAEGVSPHHLIVELHFASEEDMQRGLNSEVGQAMARDLGNFASGGATVLFSRSPPETTR